MALLTDAEVKAIQSRLEGLYAWVSSDPKEDCDALFADREERTRLLREVLRIYSVARCDEDKCGQCDGIHNDQLDDTTLLAAIREAIGDA